MEGRRDGGDVVARNYGPDGLCAAKDAGLLGLLEYGLSGCQRLIGQLAFEGAHRFAPWRGYSYTVIRFLSEQRGYALNFPGSADLTRFAYHTGWRKGEILTLEWRDIHGDVVRLRPEIAKNKDGRVIILVGEVANIIDRRRAERVESCPYVFHRQGKQVRDYSRAWGKARELAGVPERLFHDSRRTAARNMDRAQVPRSVAKQIIGHKTDAMYNRYRIVDEQDIREGMSRSENYLANTNNAHSTHK